MASSAGDSTADIQLEYEREIYEKRRAMSASLHSHREPDLTELEEEGVHYGTKHRRAYSSQINLLSDIRNFD